MDFEDVEFEPGKWIMSAIAVLVFLFIVFGALNYVGIFTNTIVERKVFENSFQYSEARKTEIATFKAQLAIIDRKLADPQLDSSLRVGLESQRDSINVLLTVAKGK